MSDGLLGPGPHARVRRLPKKASYDAGVIYAILDEAPLLPRGGHRGGKGRHPADVARARGSDAVPARQPVERALEGDRRERRGLRHRDALRRPAPGAQRLRVVSRVPLGGGLRCRDAGGRRRAEAAGPRPLRRRGAARTRQRSAGDDRSGVPTHDGGRRLDRRGVGEGVGGTDRGPRRGPGAADLVWDGAGASAIRGARALERRGDGLGRRPTARIGPPAVGRGSDRARRPTRQDCADHAGRRARSHVDRARRSIA